jgi:hypothetical protein
MVDCLNFYWKTQIEPNFEMIPYSESCIFVLRCQFVSGRPLSPTGWSFRDGVNYQTQTDLIYITYTSVCERDTEEWI